MLDEALIKFVEPIGPGQIVDRESLVALPAGRIQMTIEVNETEINVRVLSMREESMFNGHTTISNWYANAFIWQNGHVIAAEKLENRLQKAPSRPTRSRTLPRMPMVARRRARITPRTFRFIREASDDIEDATVVDAILQICVYKYQNGGVQKKPIVGTVHVALNYLTSQKSESIDQNLACDGDWFKVFPRSSFLPGCPSSIAKTNCVISGANSSSNEDLKESTINVTRSVSSVSFKHVTLRRSQSQTSSESTPQSPDSTRSRVNTDPNPKVTQRIATWVRQTILRQSAISTESTGKARTPDTVLPDDVFTMPPVLIGPRVKHADKSVMSVIPETQPNEEQPSSPSSISNIIPDQLPVPDQSRLNIAKNRMSKFRTSRSNNSSFDVGYESGRSRYLSSSDEELSYKSAESNLDVLCEKDSEFEPVQKQPDNEWFEMEIINEKGKIMPAKRKKPLTLKQRHSTLQRSARISCDDAFTSLNEIQRRSSRGSQDSAIFANA